VSVATGLRSNRLSAIAPAQVRDVLAAQSLSIDKLKGASHLGGDAGCLFGVG